VVVIAVLGSKYWRHHGRQNTRGTLAGHIEPRLTPLVYQAQDVLDAIVSDGDVYSEFRIGGGAAANDRPLVASDISGKQLSRPVSVEATALGFLGRHRNRVLARRSRSLCIVSRGKRFLPHESAEARAVISSGRQPLDC
jgi:glycerol kinase